MNKQLIALVGLLAVCGFMTGCGKKSETKSEMRHDKKMNKKHDKKMAKKHAKKDHKKDMRNGY